MKKTVTDLESKTIFGEPISCVNAILIGNKWYKTDSNKNSLEIESDPITNEIYFYFWMDDKNRICDSTRISGNINSIQAVAVD